MKTKTVSLLLACWVATLGATPPQALEQEMSGLADKVSKALLAKGLKNIANLDFTDIQGQPTELGRFLSDQLAVEIVSTGGVSMVDRANLKSILAEHKLTEEGLVNPANAKKLGEFAGVDAILTGNVTALDDGIVLLVKAISTESATIVAAGRIKFAKTSDLMLLLNRGISPNTATASSATPTTSSGGGASYQEANAIATKDIGALRVVLKSAIPIQLSGSYGAANGIRLSFEMTSRETQRPLVVGMNAKQERGYNRGSCRLGQGLRASVVDSKGVVYGLANSSMSGLSIIGVGCDDMTGYDPSQIASLLAAQDRDGPRGQSKGEYVYGSLSTISPGQSISVSMTFAQESRETPSGPSPASIQIDGEIVVGVIAAEKKTTYSLYNLTLDRVSLTKGSVSLPQPATPTAGIWAGKWSGTFGEMRIEQFGSKVTGTYSLENGRIEGIADGNVLTGRWKEQPSYAPPRDAGRFKFTLTSDGSNFTGRFGYGDSAAFTRDWVGRRASGGDLSGGVGTVGIHSNVAERK